jgi:hypothetical protein
LILNFRMNIYGTEWTVLVWKLFLQHLYSFSFLSSCYSTVGSEPLKPFFLLLNFDQLKCIPHLPYFWLFRFYHFFHLCFSFNRMLSVINSTVKYMLPTAFCLLFSREKYENQLFKLCRDARTLRLDWTTGAFSKSTAAHIKIHIFNIFFLRSCWWKWIKELSNPCLF